MTEPYSSTIDVIIPLYNESNKFTKYIDKIFGVARSKGYNVQIILVDDGSVDNTWDEICKICSIHKFVEGIRLSKNYGKDSAIFVGLNYSRGTCSVIIDGDGQHPVESISEMIDCWESGFLVVNAIKLERINDPYLVKMRANIFNLIMGWLLNNNQSGASDFKLLDKKIVKILTSQEETNSVFRYAVSNLGFMSANVFINIVPSDRPSRWRIINLFQLGLRSIMFHTDLPIKLFVYLTFFTLILTFLLVLILIINLYSRTVPVGYSTLLLLNLLSLCITVSGLTGLAVYIKTALDVISRRSRAIVCQQTRHD